MKSFGKEFLGIRTNLRLLISMALVLMLITAACSFFRLDANALSEEGNWPVIIDMHYEDRNDNEVPVGGATLEIIKVADLNTVNSDPIYMPIPEISGYVSDFYSLNTDELIDLAKTLSERISSLGLTGTLQTTNADGISEFSLKDQGVYLVRSISWPESKNTFVMNPYFINVPQKTDGTTVSYPKIEVIPPQVPVDPPKDRPNTGDEKMLSLYCVLALACGAGVGLMAILISRKKRRS